MQAKLRKFAISEAVFVFMVALTISTSIDRAYGTDTAAPVVEAAPQPDVPSVGSTVIRDTEPLKGTSDSPVPAEEPPEITENGKAAARSTDVTKTEEAVEDEMERAQNSPATALPLPPQ